MLDKAGIKCGRAGCDTGSGIRLDNGVRDITFSVPKKDTKKAVKAIREELKKLNVPASEVKVRHEKFKNGGLVTGKWVSWDTDLPAHYGQEKGMGYTYDTGKGGYLGELSYNKETGKWDLLVSKQDEWGDTETIETRPYKHKRGAQEYFLNKYIRNGRPDRTNTRALKKSAKDARAIIREVNSRIKAATEKGKHAIWRGEKTAFSRISVLKGKPTFFIQKKGELTKTKKRLSLDTQEAIDETVKYLNEMKDSLEKGLMQ